MKRDFSSKEKAIVEVDLSNQQEEEEQRKGPIPPVIVPDYGRRRLPQGIRFIDLGYIWNGSEYETLDWVDPLSATPITGNPDGTYNNYDQDFILSDFTDLADKVFEVPIEQWATVYKKIDDTLTAVVNLEVYLYGNRYLLDAAASNWTAGVFKPDLTPDYGDSTVFSVNYGFNTGSLNDGLFFDLAGTSVKVTATRDYAAPSVPLTLGNSFDCYLMPLMRHAEGTVATVVPGLSHNEILDGLKVLSPREVFFDGAHPFFGANIHSGPNWTNAGTLPQYTTVFNLIKFLQYQYPYRAIERDFAGGIYTFGALAPSAFMDPGTFPTPPTYPAVGSFTSMQLAYLFFAGGLPAQRLLAVIKQGGQFYYIWDN